MTEGTGILGLPAKFSSFRHGQSQVMSQLLTSYEDGKRYMVAEMPTGTGKTFIAMAVKQLLDVPCIYICTTKSLQEQFLKDFPTAKLIKGRGNYPCGRIPARYPEVTAEDCLGSSCTEDCPYMTAKLEARHADLVVANMSYFLNEVQGQKSMFKDRGFVVVDEADTLEDALLDQVSVQITQFDIEKMKLGKPALKTKFEEWKSWAGDAFQLIRKQEQALDTELAMYHPEEMWATAPTTLIRERKFTSRLARKMAFFLREVDQYWVWEQSKAYTKTRQEYYKWVFKPVRVDQFGDIVFQSGGKFLMMSATILDNTQYERNVGLQKYREEGVVGSIDVGSSFDPKRRPVIVRRGADITYKKIDANLGALVNQVREIVDSHPGEKGVVHAVSYRVAAAVARALGPRAVVHEPRTRAAAIQRFKESKDPLVLVSPSVERGEDFPDDICRFIVVVKLPYPYLGDPRVERRLYSMRDGQRWYTLKTVSKMIQMTGRGMRHEEDQCTSYILDPGFKRLYMEHRSMFPKWWSESIVWQEGGIDAKRTLSPEKELEEIREELQEVSGIDLGGPESRRKSTPTRGGAQGQPEPRESAGGHGKWRSIPALLGQNGGGGDPGIPHTDPLLLGEDRGDSKAEAAGDKYLSTQQAFHGRDGWPKNS